MRYEIMIILGLIVLSGCTSIAVEPEESTQIEKVVEVECPFGIVHEEYPGSCRLYVDGDNNHICDLSE